MMLGLGTDLVDIARIQRVLDRFGERFLRRVFTEAERDRCERHFDRAGAYAMRYAAKEACSKALGTGFRRGVYWRNVGVVSLPSGRPTLHLSGGALERLREVTPQGTEARVDVSLTDEPPMAHAVVVISAVPEGSP